MRQIIGIFDSQFERLHNRSLELLERLGDERLFQKPTPAGYTVETYSAGELLIRSGAAVEQVFGGLTRRLWDDPFEWTLPEELSDASAVAEYLNEVRSARIDGLEFFTSDQDLYRETPSPETLRPVGEIIAEALGRAYHLQGRSFGVAQQFVTIRPNFL